MAGATTARRRWGLNCVGAHEDGIGFFLFDWYRENVDPCLDVALQNYKRHLLESAMVRVGVGRDHAGRCGRLRVRVSIRL